MERTRILCNKNSSTQQRKYKRKYLKTILLVLMGIIISIRTGLVSITTYAWGDNGGGRKSYTVDQINKGAIGATEISDGKNYKNSENYPGTIVFNSISDSVIGDEKNFVGARVCNVQANGRCNGATKTTVWNANEIEVQDGQTYIVRAYVHNNNPNGTDAVAENTKVEFVVPENSGTSIDVNGIISSSNATPSRYWDHVTFTSDTAFHLEYVYGSALFENNKVGLNGTSLSDDVIKAGGTLIGYDKLDGRIPGCYEYDGFVTIQVKAVFDDFLVNKQVRLEGEKTWQDTVTANVGDRVEFQIEYQNLSDQQQDNVVLRDVLPPNLRLVEGSIKLMNGSYPNGATVNGTALVEEEGLRVGNYTAGSNAFVMFTAEVVDDSLIPGSNIMVNWGQASINKKTVQDYVFVFIEK